MQIFHFPLAKRKNILAPSWFSREDNQFSTLIFLPMNVKQFFATALMVSAVASYSVAQQTEEGSASTANTTATESSTVSSDTRQFMEKAATSGILEVKLGQMAQEKASSSEVKDFGEHMVAGHSQANDKLKSLAQEKGVTLPDSLTAKQQSDVDKLSKLSGQEFDQEYMKMMVKDHKKDVQTFEKAAKNLSDPAVQDFASQTLPTLKEHLQEAEDINQQLRSS